MKYIYPSIYPHRYEVILFYRKALRKKTPHFLQVIFWGFLFSDGYPAVTLLSVTLIASSHTHFHSQ